VLPALLVLATGVFAAPKLASWWGERGSYDLYMHVKPGDVFRYKVTVTRDHPKEGKLTGSVVQEIRIREMVAPAAQGELQRFIYDQSIVGMEIEGEDLTKEILELTDHKPGWNTFNIKSKRAGGQEWIPLKDGGDPRIYKILSAAGATFGSFPYERVRTGDEWVGMCFVLNQCVGCDYKMLESFRKNGRDYVKLQVQNPAVAGAELTEPMTMTIDLGHGFPTEAEYRTKSLKSGTLIHFKQELIS
jgi:hypothetical protein